MDKVINWGLLSHPMNWLIVVLMLLIAGTAAHLVLSFTATPKAS
jgi:hypothetical protein